MNLQEVVPRASHRQLDEVEANGPPPTRGNRKGHQQPGWGPMFRLDALAGGATPDEGVDVGQQLGPPYGATSQRERLVAAEVPPQRGGVKLRQHEAAQRRVSRDAQAVAALAAAVEEARPPNEGEAGSDGGGRERDPSTIDGLSVRARLAASRDVHCMAVQTVYKPAFQDSLTSLAGLRFLFWSRLGLAVSRAATGRM